MLLDFPRHHPLVFIFILSLFAATLTSVILPPPSQDGGDLPLYQRMADSLIEQGNFGGEPQKTYGSPSISPGFAIFLAGYEFLLGKSVAALLLASVLLHGLFAVGAFLLARRFFDKTTAFGAGVITALWPIFLIHTLKYGNSLLLYSTVLLWGTFLFVKSVQEDSALLAAFAGLLVGFAALVDAVAFFIPLILVLWLFLRRAPIKKTFRTSIIFLVFGALVIAPWTYRNVVVAERMGTGGAPAISKGELELVSPNRLLFIAELVASDGVLLSGLSKLFVFPYDISVLDEGTDASYKDIVTQFLRGAPPELSTKEMLVFVAKVSITFFHWAILVFAVIGFGIILHRKKKEERSFLLLTVLLTSYITIAVLGFGSLSRDDFQSISAPNSFLFPLVPLLIVSAFFTLKSLYVRSQKSLSKAAL